MPDALQVGRDPARTAADVCDRTVALGVDQLGEQRQDAPLERLVDEGIT